MNDEIKEAVSKRLGFVKMLLDLEPKKETPEQIAFNKGCEMSLSYEVKFLEKLLGQN